MQMTIKTSKKRGIEFVEQETLNDELRQHQLLTSANLYRTHYMEMFKGNDRQREKKLSTLSWDLLLKTNPEQLSKHPVTMKLLDGGIQLKNFEEANNAYRTKKAKYDLYNMSLEEFKQTEKYKRAAELVKATYNKPLNDGTSFFDYQIECAAHIVGRRRLLNAMDMGLGSAKRSV